MPIKCERWFVMTGKRWIPSWHGGFVLLSFAALAFSLPSCTHYPPTTETVDPLQLRNHVETLAVQYAPRNFTEQQNLNACADYIRRVSEQLFIPVPSGREYRNVIASYGPTNGARIVVGAHYDTSGLTPGADDNASGVAGLIELARLLGRTELNQRVDLVAYSLEEPPFFATEDMGSAHHARALRAAGVDVEAMICMEMIGFFSDEKNSQRFPSFLIRMFYPNRGNYIAVIGSWGDRQLIRKVKKSMRGATDLPVYSMSAPKSFPGLDLSDHRNYWEQHYNAVMITDTSFYRNNHYHRRSDTPDTLDYDRMANVVLGVYEAVRRMANED
jgi:hypothetical protein